MAARPQRALLGLVAISAVVLGAQADVVADPYLSWVQQTFTPYTGPGPVPSWTPKLPGKPYAFNGVDWSSVITACKALGNVEKRISAIILYLAFHDGLYFDAVGTKTSLSATQMYADELTAPASWDEELPSIVKRAIWKIASYFGSSIADAMAVCTGVAVEHLSGGRNKVIGGKPKEWKLNYRVGRYDVAGTKPAVPDGESVPATLKAYFTNLGLTTEEYIALMGLHGLSSKQDCQLPDGTYCDPSTQNCPECRSLQLLNHYYVDSCTPTLDVRDKGPMDYGNDLFSQMRPGEFEAYKRHSGCRYSSGKFKDRAYLKAAKLHAGYEPETPSTFTKSVSWSQGNCEDGKLWGGLSCAHGMFYGFTVADAYLGQACAGNSPYQLDLGAEQTAMRKYTKLADWDVVLPLALNKYLNSPKVCTFASGNAYMISGRECTKNWIVDQSLQLPSSVTSTIRCGDCKSGINSNCDARCICPGAFTAKGYSSMSSAVLPALPGYNPGTVPGTATESVASAVESTSTGITPIPVAPTGNIPPSPYVKPSDVCKPNVIVRGFPSSAFNPTPFVNVFEGEWDVVDQTGKVVSSGLNPPMAKLKKVYTNPSNKHELYVYEIDVVNVDLPLGKAAGCPAGTPTKLLAYGGQVPGPTIIMPYGRQSLVRFNNKIVTDKKVIKPNHPCTGDERPISIHLHGSASTAPFDGWAEDETCSGYTKDYLYPNNRPGTLWYHDHAYGITAENAHYGLAAMYQTRESSVIPGIGPNGADAPGLHPDGTQMVDRWGLDSLATGPAADYAILLTDRVFDDKCQFNWQPEGLHHNGYFGDVNIVSGHPWPVLVTEPKLTRFRFCNSAVSRPWLIKIVDDMGVDVSKDKCWVIAGDGGYRRQPLQFPSDGLFIAVAERYEIACEFGAYAGKTLFMWNVQDESRMKDVPFFCNSHLIMKFQIKTECTSKNCGLQKLITDVVINTHVDERLPMTELAKATAEAAAGRCDRTFHFGRGNGMWTINGETWDTARFAADVALNSHEIWCLESGGGWFHPIHIHLIDMYVLHRSSGSHPKQEQFETLVPKDVVALHPGAKVAIMPRWGPHRGKYMFHCHNLRHEDNDMMRAFDVDKRHRDIKPAAEETAEYLTLDDMEFVVESTPASKSATDLAADAAGTDDTKTLYDKYEDPEFPAAFAKRTGVPRPPLGDGHGELGDDLYKLYTDMEMYRIFYPGNKQRDLLCNANGEITNPWLVHKCT